MENIVKPEVEIDEALTIDHPVIDGIVDQTFKAMSDVRKRGYGSKEQMVRSSIRLILSNLVQYKDCLIRFPVRNESERVTAYGTTRSLRFEKQFVEFLEKRGHILFNRAPNYTNLPKSMHRDLKQSTIQLTQKGYEKISGIDIPAKAFEHASSFMDDLVVMRSRKKNEKTCRIEKKNISMLILKLCQVSRKIVDWLIWFRNGRVICLHTISWLPQRKYIVIMLMLLIRRCCAVFSTSVLIF